MHLLFLMNNFEDVKKAAEDFYDENLNLTFEKDPDGISGTSVGMENEIIGIIVHMRKNITIPTKYKEIPLFKRIES